jgi:hypothetical protein
VARMGPVYITKFWREIVQSIIDQDGSEEVVLALLETKIPRVRPFTFLSMSPLRTLLTLRPMAVPGDARQLLWRRTGTHAWLLRPHG